ncbi:precorrin-3B synthase [Actibacterium pelagium]|uniref:Precorrin-3B synthase n=1 Tax=Actibacterium pelagium TaxID=2029103 RepID=A0A917ALM3_9RHOB|nr:precorrin-3B synthase [Actibacterium pelagium]GGE60730.1 precorrin-3B synthase [Actibacterium pelagium]
MSTPEIKGWCPGALRPMMSGDGLVVRIRPRLARLTAEQAMGIADLSRRFGNGLIDLSSRANVQLRGVTEASHSALIDGLRDLGLVDDDAALEARRNITVTPFWTGVDETCQIAAALETGLAGPDAPALPGKFGFAVDCGPSPVLQDVSADIRIERNADGLICRADGGETGMPVTERTAAEAALELASWFLGTGGAPDGRGRMAKHLASGVQMPQVMCKTKACQSSFSAHPGATKTGALVGFEFGQIDADLLSELAALGPIRVTPWRMLLLEQGDVTPDLGPTRTSFANGRDNLITQSDDPRLRVTACTGAPACTQAIGETRPLARRLANAIAPNTHLHVSGCSKGCAHPTVCDITLVATAPDEYDLIRNGRAQDAPAMTGLTQDQIQEALNAPHL